MVFACTTKYFVHMIIRSETFMRISDELQNSFFVFFFLYFLFFHSKTSSWQSTVAFDIVMHII